MQHHIFTATPKHASNHASGGSDPVTPESISALSEDGTAVNSTRWDGSAKVVSAMGPSGGVDGDVWFMVV